MRALEPSAGRRIYGLRALVGLPVRIGEVGVGRVSEVLLDRSHGHCLGFVLESLRDQTRLAIGTVTCDIEAGRVIRDGA